MLLGIFVSGCRNGSVSPTESPVFSSYREIPGITPEEINAIETLQNKGKTLSYQLLKSGEIDAYILENNAEALFLTTMTTMYRICPGGALSGFYRVA